MLTFLIGFMVGGLLGFTLCALLAAERINQCRQRLAPDQEDLWRSSD